MNPVLSPHSHDLGRMAANGINVKMLQTALSHAETDVNTIPSLLRNIAGQDAWKAFVFPEAPDQIYRWNAADFREFIEAPRPAGCNTPIHVLERMLRETDVWELYLELTRGEPGGSHNTEQNKEAISGKYAPTVNRDLITVDGAPNTIPFQQAEPPAPRVRDYAREAPTGTSTSYHLRRISKDRPDLYEKIRTGEMSPHKAMVVAGFKLKPIMIPFEAKAAARILRRHFQGETLKALIRHLETTDEEGETNP